MTWFRVFSFETLIFVGNRGFNNKVPFKSYPPFHEKHKNQRTSPFWSLKPIQGLALFVLLAHFSVCSFIGMRAPLLNIFAEPIKDLELGSLVKKRCWFFQMPPEKILHKKKHDFSAENMVIFYIPTQLSHLPTKTVLISLSANASDASKAYICHARMKNH